jgi:hypothetical protein
MLQKPSGCGVRDPGENEHKRSGDQETVNDLLIS